MLNKIIELWIKIWLNKALKTLFTENLFDFICKKRYSKNVFGGFSPCHGQWFKL